MRRPYSSPERDRQQLQTRARILAVATERFAVDGYTATTVAAIASTAGVTAQTVYNAYGTKRDLLKAAYDVALAGDDAAVPLAERPEVRALYELTDAPAFLHGYAKLGRQLLDRVGPLMLQIAAGAAAGDADLVDLQQVTDGERLIGTLMVARRVDELGALHPAVSPEDARDRLWTLNSVGVWHLLTGRRGWSGERYEDWIGAQMCAAVLAPGGGGS